MPFGVLRTHGSASNCSGVTTTVGLALDSFNTFVTLLAEDKLRARLIAFLAPEHAT